MQLDHAAIRECLPVRHPMLLVDRVVALEPGVSITAEKAVTGSEPCYQRLPDGLPPDRYAYPSALVLESFGQAAALLWVHTARAGAGPAEVLMLAGLRRCRVEGRVFPGDVLRHEIRIDQVVHGNAFSAGATYVGDRRVASVGSLVAVRRPRSSVMV
jgi:3-hydroxyacyl-[acyl-carrier-protein] dehydratase